MRIKSTLLVICLTLTGFACAAEYTLETAAAKLQQEDASASEMFSLSFFFEEAGRPFSALEAADRAIRLDPEMPGYHARKGQLLALRKRYREAAIAYGTAADKAPDAKAFRAAEARLLDSCGMWQEAARAWSSLFEGADESKEILDSAQRLQELCRKTGEPEKAENIWRQAFAKLTEKADRTTAANAASDLMFLQGRYREAVAFWKSWFDAAKAIEEKFELARQLQATLAKVPEAGRKKLAVADLEAWQALEKSAENGEQKNSALLGQAHNRLLIGNFDEAIALLNTVLPGKKIPERLSDGERDALYLLDKAYALAGYTDRRIEVWTRVFEKPAQKIVTDSGFDYGVKSEALEYLEQARGGEKLLDYRAKLVDAFPQEPQPHLLLAEAWEENGEYRKSLDEYCKWLDLEEKQEGYHPGDVMPRYEKILSLCGKCGDFAQFEKLMSGVFQYDHGQNQINNHLNLAREYFGLPRAMMIADKVAEKGGVYSWGAGIFFNSLEMKDKAAAFFTQAMSDSEFQFHERESLMRMLVQLARNYEEKITRARGLVNFAKERWERQRAYQIIIEQMAGEGKVVDALQLAREIEAVSNDNNKWDFVQALALTANYILQGNRVGKELRTATGRDQAQSAAIAFWSEYHAKYPNLNLVQNVSSLWRNLAEIQRRAGDLKGGVSFLHALCTEGDDSFLRLAGGEFLAGCGEKALADSEYLSYLDIAPQDMLKSSSPPAANRHSLYGLDYRFLNYVAKADLSSKAKEKLEEGVRRSEGSEKEVWGDMLITFHKHQGNAEAALAVVEQMLAWGHDAKVYQREKAALQQSIRLANSRSRADTQARDNLLRQVERWQKVFEKNPEDYQAAVNIYLTCRLLGQKDKGAEFLDAAKLIAPDDPAIIEILAREDMLQKRYADAVEQLARAAEISGRGDDYEQTMAQAFELAGKNRQSLSIYLDALAAGRRPATPEQLLDLAERSDNLDFLHQEIFTRVLEKRQRNIPLDETTALLALRLAWDRVDEKLAEETIADLLLKYRSGSAAVGNAWELRQLLERAQQRGRIGDVIKLMEGMRDYKLALGNAPVLNEYRQLAALYLQHGNPDQAADLLFSGLAYAKNGAADEVPYSPRRDLHEQSPEFQSTAGWEHAIIELAATEARAGSTEFRKAGGTRFEELVQRELAVMEKHPRDCASPLTDVGTAQALGVLEQVTAAYRNSPGTSPDKFGARLALANHFVRLAQAGKRDDFKVEELFSALDSAADIAQARNLGGCEYAQIATVYQKLLSMGSDKKLEGVTLQLALEKLKQLSVALGEENFLLADKCYYLAISQGAYDKALAYARLMQAQAKGVKQVDMNLAMMLLRNGDGAGGAEVLRALAEKSATYQDYENAGNCCLANGSDQTAFAAGEEFLLKSVSLYCEETGAMSALAENKDDYWLHNANVTLARFCALQGKPEGAAKYILEALRRNGRIDTVRNWTNNLTSALTKPEDREKLLAVVAAAAGAEPENADLRLLHASFLDSLADYTEAFDAFKQAYAISPELSTARLLIDAALKAKEPNAALAYCREWAQSFPRDAEAYEKMGEICRLLNDPEGATRALSMLVELSPRDADNCRRVAVSFAEQGEPHRAETLLARAVELRPEEPYRHVDLAEVLHLNGKEEEAEKICRDALARDWAKGLSPELLARLPSWQGTFELRAWSLLGEIYTSLKKEDLAARARLNLPPGYERPNLRNAVPVPGRRFTAFTRGRTIGKDG